MKRLSSILYLLLTLSISASSASKEPKLDAQTQQQVIDRVKVYCNLMQEFSGDVEKIENMDKILDMCENSNVSVFNDLATASTKDISDNSMPLQQYMMMVTDKFENNVKTSYSGYKYVKMVVQPSPLKEFDAARYAFVKVDKQVDAPGIKSKQRLNIIVNTSTMKVSSTISEDYEDPQRVYLEALEKFNDGDYKAAVPLFEKVSVLQRFSGRFRAKSMLGWIYAEQKEYQKAYDLLREGSTEDPLGGVLLASKILMNNQVLVNLINFTEGVNILKRLSNVRDKEIPTMHLIAQSTIAEASINLQTLTSNIELTEAERLKISNDLISDPATNNAFRMRGYWLKGISDYLTGDAEKRKNGLKYLDKAEGLLYQANLDALTYEHWDLQLSVSKMIYLKYLEDNDGFDKIIRSLAFDKPYSAGIVAQLLLGNGDYENALIYFRKASDIGDPYATYIVSLTYLPPFRTPFPTYVNIYLSELFRMNSEAIPRDKWIEFVGFLLKDRSQVRSSEEFLKWNQKAINLGDVNAMEDRAFFEAVGDIPCNTKNIEHALDLACTAACVGMRSRTFKLGATYAWAIASEMNSNISFENTTACKYLKGLDMQGNGAASYLLAAGYMTELKDTVQAINYLERSKNAHYYDGMYEYGKWLLEEKKDYNQAFTLFKLLTVYPVSYAYSKLGNIEKDYRHNYYEAVKYYQEGIGKDQDFECYEGLSDIYKDGLGCEKDLNKAKEMIEAAIAFVELKYGGEVANDDFDDIVRLKKKKNAIDSLITAEGGTNAVSPIARLNQVLVNTLGEDARIEQSQKALAEVFASPKAIVKTVGSNGKTIVSTETAEDFMLRLATMKTDKMMVEVSSKKDNNNKLTELTIQMK